MPRGVSSFSNRSVDVGHFSMVPRANIPRSVFRVESTHKTTFNAGDLIPVYVEEVIPGDSFRVSMTAFARLATPLFPIMDNLHLESFWFFVPCRLLWTNWVRMMGEQLDPPDSTGQGPPSSSTDFVVPTLNTSGSQGGLFTPNSIFDYMGIPVSFNAVNDWLNGVPINALPFRAVNLIYNEWFRDENLQNRVTFSNGDGPDTASWYGVWKRGKRHDYFTSCLPFTQKGAAQALPLGGTAPITGLGFRQPNVGWAPGQSMGVIETGNVGKVYPQSIYPVAVADPPPAGQGQLFVRVANAGAGEFMPDVYADLSKATAATINQLRQAFQIQKLLERDARGGTRYTELLRSHFGVFPPDFRLQRPEYLGGGHSMITVNPVAQTSNPQSTAQPPVGTLGAVGHMVAQHGFSHSFTEHGYIIGLVSVRADLTYSQGLRKMWSRRTRYDFYWPVFAHLGEQPVMRQELYCTNDLTGNNTTFGYQERWAEYRHKPSMITGKFRTFSGQVGLDTWHLAEFFSTPPVLGATFITDPTQSTLERALAAGQQARGQQLLFDSVFQERRVRPMPAYSVPGFVDHF